MNKKELAKKIFQDGFNCTQAVLSVFCDELKLEKDLALRIGTGFGGGARNGELCGAVSGALMMIGLKNGHSVQGDNETKQKAYNQSKLFTDEFKRCNGDIVCKNLLGYDLSIPEEYKYLDEKGLFKTECPIYICSAVEILERFLQEEKI